MPWTTPDLRTVREMVRNDVTAALYGAVLIGNSVLRVMSDCTAAVAHLTLRYIDWLAKQLLPDTAEQVWLDRHGNIWLVNADGSTGRKSATYAMGSATATGLPGYVVPSGTILNALGITYQTTAAITIGAAATPMQLEALTPGSIGNLDPGTTMGFATPIAGIDSNATVLEMDGGADTETDDELRARVLQRIQKPPMGGDADDFVAWAESVPGVTRAWCAPLEMGIGTVTVRFMMDSLRANNGGFPLPEDIDTVYAYIDTVRPVAVKDFFVAGPIPYPINVHIKNLSSDTAAIRANIEQSLLNKFFDLAIPGETWYRSWTDEGIAEAVGVNSYDLTAAPSSGSNAADGSVDQVMPAPGYMAVLGDITYG